MPITTYPHIRMDGEVAMVGQSRYKVIHLAGEHYGYGWSAEELLRQHTDLLPEEVYAALGFFYDHYDEMVEQIRSEARKAEDLRSNSNQLSRTELLKRKTRFGAD